MYVVETFRTLLQLHLPSLAAEVSGALGGVRHGAPLGVLWTAELLLEDERRTAVVPGRVLSLAPVVLVPPLAALVRTLSTLRSGGGARAALLAAPGPDLAVVSPVSSEAAGLQAQRTEHAHNLAGP